MAEEKDTSTQKENSAVKNNDENQVVEDQSNTSIADRFDLEQILGEKTYEFYLANKTSKRFCCCTSSIAYWYSWLQIHLRKQDFNSKQTESLEAIWRAENKAFDEQSWNEAINGDSLVLFDGFKKVSEDFEGYQGGDIALYNLGISYLNNKEYQEAITTLEKVNFDDELLGTVTYGAIGDAFTTWFSE